eukprot:scaffold321_cov67-Phaeocystis_antarctica.AAC.2
MGWRWSASRPWRMENTATEDRPASFQPAARTASTARCMAVFNSDPAGADRGGNYGGTTCWPALRRASKHSL